MFLPFLMLLFLHLGTCTETCMYSTQQLLLSIFVLRFILNIEKVVQPYINQFLMYCTSTGSADSGGGAEERELLNAGEGVSDNLLFLLGLSSYHSLSNLPSSAIVDLLLVLVMMILYCKVAKHIRTDALIC